MPFAYYADAGANGTDITKKVILQLILIILT